MLVDGGWGGMATGRDGSVTDVLGSKFCIFK